MAPDLTPRSSRIAPHPSHPHAHVHPSYANGHPAQPTLRRKMDLINQDIPERPEKVKGMEKIKSFRAIKQGKASGCDVMSIGSHATGAVRRTRTCHPPSHATAAMPYAMLLTPLPQYPNPPPHCPTTTPPPTPPPHPNTPPPHPPPQQQRPGDYSSTTSSGQGVTPTSPQTLEMGDGEAGDPTPWTRWSMADHKGPAAETALRCRIRRTADIMWQENPPRVLKYRTSHLHYWGEGRHAQRRVRCKGPLARVTFI